MSQNDHELEFGLEYVPLFCEIKPNIAALHVTCQYYGGILSKTKDE
jgi:hypothetical protein